MGATRRRMDAAVEDARRRLASLRTGRASVDLVVDVPVAAWGSELPLAQVAQVGVQPPRGLVVTPHDPSLVPAVARALELRELGAPAQVDGVRIRIQLPAPSDERRVQLAREAREVAEAARVGIRLARRDALNELRRRRAAEEVSEGKLRGRSKDLQAWTDAAVEQVDEYLATALEAIGA